MHSLIYLRVIIKKNIPFIFCLNIFQLLIPHGQFHPFGNCLVENAPNLTTILCYVPRKGVEVVSTQSFLREFVSRRHFWVISTHQFCLRLDNQYFTVFSLFLLNFHSLIIFEGTSTLHCLCSSFVTDVSTPLTMSCVREGLRTSLHSRPPPSLR